MSTYKITKVSDVNQDGSQDIWVEGLDKPFHVSADWLKQQPNGVAVDDIISHDGKTLTLQPTPAKEGPQPADEAEKTPPLKTEGFAPNYIANPVEVEAFEIVSVSPVKNKDGSLNIALSNGLNEIASADMLSRITPEVGDYWIKQADDYVYLNPKAVFERKYAPLKAG